MKAAEFPVAGEKVTAFWPHYPSKVLIDWLWPVRGLSAARGVPMISKAAHFVQFISLNSNNENNDDNLY